MLSPLLKGCLERRTTNTDWNWLVRLQPWSTRRGTSTSLFNSRTRKDKRCSTQISCIFALEFVTAMENGSLRTKLGKTSWRERQKWNSTTDRAHFWRYTPDKWAEATKMESWTLWSTPNPLCCNSQATAHPSREKWTAALSSPSWSKISASGPKRKSDPLWSLWFSPPLTCHSQLPFVFFPLPRKNLAQDGWANDQKGDI